MWRAFIASIPATLGKEDYFYLIVLKTLKKKNEPWELPSTNLFRKDLEIRILVMITAFEKNSAKNVQTLFWANAYGVEAP